MGEDEIRIWGLHRKVPNESLDGKVEKGVFFRSREGSQSQRNQGENQVRWGDQ